MKSGKPGKAAEREDTEGKEKDEAAENGPSTFISPNKRSRIITPAAKVDTSLSLALHACSLGNPHICQQQLIHMELLLIHHSRAIVRPVTAVQRSPSFEATPILVMCQALQLQDAEVPRADQVYAEARRLHNCLHMTGKPGAGHGCRRLRQQERRSGSARGRLGLTSLSMTRPLSLRRQSLMTGTTASRSDDSTRQLLKWHACFGLMPYHCRSG